MNSKDQSTEEAEAQSLVDQDEAEERSFESQNQAKPVNLLHTDALLEIFSNFLPTENDPFLREKRERLPPLITKAAQKGLVAGVHDFVTDLVAEVDCIASECASLWKRRAISASIPDLKRDLAQLMRLKRKGRDLEVPRMADLFDLDEFGKRSVGEQMISLAKERIGAQNLGPRSEFLSFYPE